MNFYPPQYPQQLQPQTNGQLNDMDCIIEPYLGKSGLYVGNYGAASNPQMLRSRGIRAVVTTAAQADVQYDRSVIPNHIKVEALDYPNFSLEPYFDQVSSFIKAQLPNTNVLVHCMAGVSRSVSFVIAYLIKYRGVTFNEALARVKSCRSVANPNAGFTQQLKRFEERHRMCNHTGQQPQQQNKGMSPQPRQRSRSPGGYMPNPNQRPVSPRGHLYGSAQSERGNYDMPPNNYPQMQPRGHLYGSAQSESNNFYPQPSFSQDVPLPPKYGTEANLPSDWQPNFQGFNKRH